MRECELNSMRVRVSVYARVGGCVGVRVSLNVAVGMRVRVRVRVSERVSCVCEYESVRCVRV